METKDEIIIGGTMGKGSNTVVIGDDFVEEMYDSIERVISEDLIKLLKNDQNHHNK